MDQSEEMLVRRWFPARGEEQTRPQVIANTIKGWIDENDRHVMTFMFELGGRYFAPEGKGETPKDALRNMCIEAERMFDEAYAELATMQNEGWEV